MTTEWTDEQGRTPRRRSGGRPSGSRRVDLLVALGIVLPGVVALAIAVIGREEDPLAGLRPPQTAALTAATLICPSSVAADGAPVRVTRVPDVPGGELAAQSSRAGAGSLTGARVVSVAPGDVVVVPRSAGATALTGEGRGAPGIIAGRGDRLAVPECRPPSYDEWLVGLGASARYSSTVELVNPDDGDAVVDIELHDAAGPVEEPALRGIQVPARGVQRINLSEVAPRSRLTAGHLTVVRGRVAASVRTTRDPLGRSRVTTEFLPAQARPATENLVLGVPDDFRGGILTLANPGEDETRARIRLVTEDAVFSPTGAEDVVVAPKAIASVDLRSILEGEVAEGVVGVLVESVAPLAASVRGLAGGDLVLLGPAVELRDPTAAVLPDGPKELVLGGALRPGVVHVHSYDAAGRVITKDRVEVGADRAARLALRPTAAMITVEARNTPISGTVTIPTSGTRPGFAALRLRAGEVHARVPAVGPE